MFGPGQRRHSRKFALQALQITSAEEAEHLDATESKSPRGTAGTAQQALKVLPLSLTELHSPFLLGSLDRLRSKEKLG